MQRLGFIPDPWQEDALRAKDDRLLLLCSRQSGKSTTTATLGLHTALYETDALILLLSPTQRQSDELFRKVVGFYHALESPVRSVQKSSTTLTLANGSRVVSLPGSPDTIRGYSAPRLVIIDEAALTDDELFVATMPMLAASAAGRLVCLSSPFGQRGWFHAQWDDPSAPWRRIKATAFDCPRISREFLDEQRTMLGQSRFEQEFLCVFTSAVNQVFSTESILAAFRSDAPPLFPAGY
jgi:hypothetical protein